jgi:hypothetical protein
MITFKEYVKMISEDNTAGGGGVFGSGESFGHGGDFGNSDFYAKENGAIIPFALGTFKRNKRISRKRKKSK